MPGLLANSAYSTTPLSSYTPSSTGGQSPSSTLSSTSSSSYSTLPSSSPSASSGPSSVTLQSPLPTFPKVTAPLAPVEEGVTISKQQLLYITVSIAFFILIILSCLYNAHREKKRLLSHSNMASSTVKMNPVTHNTSMV
jgi:hypothetical protein